MAITGYYSPSRPEFFKKLPAPHLHRSILLAPRTLLHSKSRTPMVAGPAKG